MIWCLNKHESWSVIRKTINNKLLSQWKTIISCVTFYEIWIFITFKIISLFVLELFDPNYYYYNFKCKIGLMLFFTVAWRKIKIIMLLTIILLLLNYTIILKFVNFKSETLLCLRTVIVKWRFHFQKI